MSWLKNIFSNNNRGGILPQITKSRNINIVNIPEPTRSLLWITNEDTSKISSPFTIRMTITLNVSGIKNEIDHGHNFYAEPSLIWTKLPIEKNNELEEKSMYYPSYSHLYPKNRFQYLNWLCDITQPTNLSYVFLYFYGLERHLLVGNYDLAVMEILKLLKYHDQSSFKSYAQNALIVASLYKKRVDVLENNPILTDGLNNEVLIVRQLIGKNITSKEVIEIASHVGFKNKRYIKLHPDKFELELNKLIESFEQINGKLIDLIKIKDLKQEKSTVFANMSLPENIRSINVPVFLYNEKFQLALKKLLEQAHANVKCGLTHKK